MLSSIMTEKPRGDRAKIPPAFCFQADDEGTIPFTRSNKFNDLGGKSQK